jgi:MOSC domain-containing protein YiiM
VMGTIYRIDVSPGGVPKMPVTETDLTLDGLVGDKQKHLQFHGGPDRAICLYSYERILELQREGHPIAPGTIGENVTIAGLDWSVINPGVRLTLGERAIVEITKPAVPCKSTASSFANVEFIRVSNQLHPGWSRFYARVLHSGRLVVGQRVEVFLNAYQVGLSTI